MHNLLWRPLVAAQHRDVIFTHHWHHFFVQNAVLLVHQLMGAHRNFIQRLGLGQAVRPLGWGRIALQNFYQATHAHFKKLVEIGGKNTQESQPLQQWQTAVIGLMQNTFVEFEQAQLAVEIGVIHLVPRNTIHVKPISCARLWQLCDRNKTVVFLL